MLFPASERVVFNNNPLEEVICQLRFPTILEISSADPVHFQNKVRDAYPLYEREGGESLTRDVLPKEVSHFLTQFHLASPTEVSIHKFLTEDSERFISLSSDFLAMTEKGYYRWEQFQQEIESARTALEEVYKPAFYSRIGLRYRDIIDKAALGLKDEPWELLVNSAFIGLLGTKEICSNVQEIRTNTLIRIGDVGDGFVRLRHGLTKKRDGDEAYRIDADFFIEGRREGKDVRDTLGGFNRLAGNLFRWATTDRLKKALEPVAID